MHGLQEINDDGIIGKYKTTNANKLDNNLSSVELQTAVSKTLSIQPQVGIPSTQMSFDDALGLIKFGKIHYILILAFGLNLTAITAEISGISYVLPVSQCDLKLTTKQKGILTAIGYGGVIFSSYLWGILADAMGRRKVLLPSLLLTVTCSIVSSFTNNFIMFLILRFFNGFFLGCSMSTFMAYFGEFHNAKIRSRNIMFASVIHGLTCMIIPIIAYLVINQEWQFHIPIINVTYNSWRLFIVIASVPSLICALIIMYLPESPKYMLSKGYEKEAIRIIKFMYCINNGANVTPPVIESIVDEMDSEFKKKNNANDITNNINNNNNNNNNKELLAIINKFWIQTIPLFKHPYIRSTCMVCVLQFFIFISSNGIYIWIPEILNRVAEYLNTNSEHNISICQIMYKKGLNLTAILQKDNQFNETLSCKLEFDTIQYSFIMEIMYTIGFIATGVLVNYVRNIVMLSIITIGSGICGLLLPISTIPLLGIYFSILLCSSRTAGIVLTAITIELFPTNIRATAVCISAMTGRMGAVVGANIAGLLLDNYCEYLFSLTGFILISCGVLAFFIPKVQQQNK